MFSYSSHLWCLHIHVHVYCIVVRAGYEYTHLPCASLVMESFITKILPFVQSIPWQLDPKRDLGTLLDGENYTRTRTHIFREYK